MALPISLSQASLAATLLGSACGTYHALTPPNPSEHKAPATGDSIRGLYLTSKHTTRAIFAPLGLLALHASSLALLYPDLPTFLLRNGAENGFNADLITWSTSTAIPLAMILCVGVPLRLVPYASLGKNFTFALREPDQLKTTGIYRYVQHPSYTGIFILMGANVVLLGRMDGVLSCWVPPEWYTAFAFWSWALSPVVISAVLYGIWTRVREEEDMLKGAFKQDWENWHARTARFIPFVL
ncbi:hypothetical protein F66182_7745 [Fusarium sp. NRRL 66182]|nr:hypothetical protein F66182_7745 [Fusarium sp. NRRL 66182]